MKLIFQQKYTIKPNFYFLFFLSFLGKTILFPQGAFAQPETLAVPSSGLGHSADHPSLPSLATFRPHYQFFGSASISAITVPTRTTWFPGLSLQAGFACFSSTFCKQYQVEFLHSFALFSFSQTDPDEERSRSSDLHLPFANVTLHGLDLRFSPRISLTLSNFQFLRSPIYLDESVNVQESLGTLRIAFGKRQRTLVNTECFFDLSSAGFKYVSYASFHTVPFIGLHMIGIKQGCAVHVGNQVGATFAYAIKSELFVGQSGASIPDQPGSFGSILSENRAGFSANLDFVTPKTWQQAGITGFHMGGWASLFFHINQGCFYASVSTSSVCGSNSQKFEPRLGLSFSMDFGGPSASQKSQGLNPIEFSL